MKKMLFKDIAAELKISIPQVSRALSGREYIAAGLRTKVIQLAKHLGYRNMSFRQRKRIAVLIHSFSDFNIHLLNEIRKEAKKRPFDIAVIPMENINLLNDQTFAGAFAISQDAAELRWHERFKIPLVTINNYGEPLDNINSVLPDADLEVRFAVEHFLSLGHKKIARIRFQSVSSTKKEMLRGVDEFYRIAEANGIRNSVCKLCVTDSKAEIKALLELAEQGYTAFVVVMSDWAPHLLHAISQTGRKVPDDISLITYESKSSANQTPPLTTLEYDYERIVKTAFAQLFPEFRRKSKTETGSQELIPCKLIIRESTAPFRLNRSRTAKASAAGKKDTVKENKIFSQNVK